MSCEPNGLAVSRLRSPPSDDLMLNMPGTKFGSVSSQDSNATREPSADQIAQPKFCVVAELKKTGFEPSQLIMVMPGRSIRSPSGDQRGHSEGPHTRCSFVPSGFAM